jgi:hypothetical protein
MNVPGTDALRSYDCTKERNGVCLSPSQVRPGVLLRPVHRETVNEMKESLRRLGFMEGAASLIFVHQSGGLGTSDAIYEVVDGHHRSQALYEMWSGGEWLDFQVSPLFP